MSVKKWEIHDNVQKDFFFFFQQCSAQHVIQLSVFRGQQRASESLDKFTATCETSHRCFCRVSHLNFDLAMAHLSCRLTYPEFQSPAPSACSQCQSRYPMSQSQPRSFWSPLHIYLLRTHRHMQNQNYFCCMIFKHDIIEP